MVVALAGSLIATFVLQHEDTSASENISRDYPAVAAEGILRAALEYNSISLHLDGDTLSGFDYELIEAFARDHDLRV